MLVLVLVKATAPIVNHVQDLHALRSHRGTVIMAHPLRRTLSIAMISLGRNVEREESLYAHKSEQETMHCWEFEYSAP